MSIDDRSVLLLGEDNVALLKTKIVAVFGLGGVGGTAFEALVRSGNRPALCAMDRDVVDEIESEPPRCFIFRNDIGEKKGDFGLPAGRSDPP
jgi:tRNA A37 threonylcarbamoyladenosine dehydratase